MQGTSLDASMGTQDNQSIAINTNRCEYFISSANNMQCQNPTSYNYSHCPSSFSLKHGLQHQQDLQAAMHRLLAEAEVSYDDLIKRRFCFTRKFLRSMHFMKAGGSFVLINKLYIRLLHCLSFYVEINDYLRL